MSVLNLPSLLLPVLTNMVEKGLECRAVWQRDHWTSLSIIHISHLFLHHFSHHIEWWNSIRDFWDPFILGNPGFLWPTGTDFCGGEPQVHSIGLIIILGSWFILIIGPCMPCCFSSLFYSFSPSFPSSFLLTFLPCYLLSFLIGYLCTYLSIVIL